MATATLNLTRRQRRAEEPEWLVWAVVLAMLVGGLLLRATVAGRTVDFGGDGVALRYPAEWVSQAEEGSALAVSDPFSAPGFPRQLRVRQVPLTEVGQNLATASDVTLAWSGRQARELDNYRELNVQATTVGGQPATRIEYAFVAEPRGGGNIPPVVARAEDLLIQRGDTLTVVTFASENSDWEAAYNVWEDLLPALRLQ